MTTHIASAGRHGEQRCGRCGKLLFQASEGWIIYGLASDWEIDSWTHYPYRAGDKVVRGLDWQAVALAPVDNAPLCEEQGL